MSTSDRAGVAPVANPPPALTAADLAAALQVSVRTVRRMMARGEVRAIRFGRSVRVPVDEAKRLLGTK
jgi:excisionase family DNA binding protein